MLHELSLLALAATLGAQPRGVTILPYLVEDVSTSRCKHVCPDGFTDGLATEPHVSKRIIIGADITRGDIIPWMVRLRIFKNDGKSMSCGGTILTDRWILTAGHCVIQSSSKSTIRIFTGSVSKKEADWPIQRSEKFYRYKGVYTSENYYINPDSMPANPIDEINIDIALVRTSQRILFNRMTKPACFSQDTIEELQQTPSRMVTKFYLAGLGGKHPTLRLAESFLKCSRISDFECCDKNDPELLWKTIKHKEEHGGFCITNAEESAKFEDGDSGSALFATRLARHQEGVDKICLSHILAVYSGHLMGENQCGCPTEYATSILTRIDAARPNDVQWIKTTTQSTS